MRRTLLVFAVFFLGCAQAEPPVSETTTTTEETAAISLADVAGVWDGTVTSATSDSALALVELTATAEATGWSMKVANAKTPTEWTTVPATSVVAAGDSVVVDAGPFKSVLRPGQDVTTHSVYRLQGGNLSGTLLATYPATGETIELHTSATRKP